MKTMKSLVIEAAKKCKEDCYECPKDKDPDILRLMKERSKWSDICWIRRCRFSTGELVGNEFIIRDFQKKVLSKISYKGI